MPDLASDHRHVDGYLNTASIGLPCDTTITVMHDVIDRWQRAELDVAQANEAVEASRATFARLVGARVADVAIGSQVSALVGMIAASLPHGAQVLCPEGEFTSVLFPFLARGDDLRVRTVPLEDLADAIRPSTSLVAFSVVQSADGRLADTESIIAAASANGTLTLADTTQACGWLPVDATRFDLTVAAAYKWLSAPRGSAFLVAGPSVRDRLTPILAGWFAARDHSDAFYGAPLRLAEDARGFDTSPAWFSWAGTAPALAHIERLTIAAIHEHDLRLASTVRAALGLEETGSAIAALSVTDQQAAALEHAGVTATSRAGRLRLGFHLYNDENDVDRVLGVLA